MLILKNITKKYKIGDSEKEVLKNINLEIGNNQFIVILGPSGSGKTTLLNIIGAIDNNYIGNLYLNNQNTKEFKNRNWNSYRNNLLGYVFQNYHLIEHISVLENVKLPLLIKGTSNLKSRRRAILALTKVGLIKHINKKPNQLSGGQKQRVAIARAIINDPKIILADEPTGALDSKASIEIMDLLKDLSKDKTIIMVTHNEILAKKYANRIIYIEDGQIVKDNCFINKKDKINILFKKTKMPYLESLKIAFKNLVTKKGRTILTSFGCSVGLIGILLILSLSQGFKEQLKVYEKEYLSNMPIIIDNQNIKDNNLKEYSKSDKIYIEDNNINNNLNDSVIETINQIDKNLLLGISHNRYLNINIVNSSNKFLESSYLEQIPSKEYIKKNYDLLYGNYPNNKFDFLLVIDNKNKVDSNISNTIDVQNKSNFKNIVNSKLYLILNNDYYEEINNEFVVKNNFSNKIKLNITGIIRPKEDGNNIEDNSKLLYQEDLINYIIFNNQNSNITEKQAQINYNILTKEKINSNEKEALLSFFGANNKSYQIKLYPKDYLSKNKIIKILKNNSIKYTDLSKNTLKILTDTLDIIKIVLILFSLISLIVSSIMIAIITYISVLERTKEIGILRCLGARKKDIKHIFNSENIIIGFISGVLAVILTKILLIPTNKILFSILGIKNIGKLEMNYIVLILIISIALTIFGGIIPTIIASKKEIIETLKNE